MMMMSSFPSQKTVFNEKSVLTSSNNNNDFISIALYHVKHPQLH